MTLKSVKTPTITFDTNKQTRWSVVRKELYRQSDRRLSVKLVPNLADRGCHVVNTTDPHGRQSRFSRPEAFDTPFISTFFRV
jgi:hypothetical protein